jgi:hypothetical protein
MVQSSSSGNLWCVEIVRKLERSRDYEDSGRVSNAEARVLSTCYSHTSIELVARYLYKESVTTVRASLQGCTPEIYTTDPGTGRPCQRVRS